jgi:hypothetical protein
MNSQAVVLSWILFSGAALAQSAAPRANVNAQVKLIGSAYVYIYSVSVVPSSTSPIWWLSVDVSQPLNGLPLTGTGLTNGSGYLAYVSQAVASSPTSLPTIPVGLSAPMGWSVGLSADGTAAWSADSAAANVISGGQQQFQLTSYGLPSIRILRVKAPIDYDNLPFASPADPQDLPRYESALESYQSSLATELMSIGPTAPPATFNAFASLQNLQDLKDQALQLGWITDVGVGKSIDAKLKAARAALNEHEVDDAREILYALLHELSAQAGKHLSNEAVALLQLNTQYLLSHL